VRICFRNRVAVFIVHLKLELFLRDSSCVSKPLTPKKRQLLYIRSGSEACFKLGVNQLRGPKTFDK